MNAIVQPKFSLQDYLAWEGQQTERHEFFRGEVFAMVGAKRIHGRVVSNLSAELRQSLKETPCQVFHEALELACLDIRVAMAEVFAGVSPRANVRRCKPAQLGLNRRVRRSGASGTGRSRF